MHHSTLLLSLLLALLPQGLRAQDGPDEPATARGTRATWQGPSFISAQDSIDFTRFMQESASPEGTVLPFVMDADYRLVWHEHHSPGWWVVTRGDGRTLRAFNADPPLSCPPMGCVSQPLSPGRMVIVHDPPMGLYCIDRWYFEAR